MAMGLNMRTLIRRIILKETEAILVGLSSTRRGQGTGFFFFNLLKAIIPDING